MEQRTNLAWSAGAVAIGRNEGERLDRCLRSLLRVFDSIVYVDSGSNDGSVALAESLGVHVVRLDTDRPFNAGRARNAGFARLCEIEPAISLVQFIDGDCVLERGWLDAGARFLQHQADTAVVCGRRRELCPESSIYNLLCDIEWDTPIGYADACGGDFLVRREAFDEVGGFNSQIIAGEEPELCHRLQLKNWRIFRMDQAMTLHDAAMDSVGQWARRSCRSGYAYLSRAVLHIHDGTRYCWRENARIVFWAAVLPLSILSLSVFGSAWFLLAFGIYSIQFARLRRTIPASEQITRSRIALFMLFGYWAEFSGQILFLFRQLRRSEQQIIEYK